MRERAEQPWADHALTRSMRGLITSYLRVGAANAWRVARTLRPPTLVIWGARDKLVDPAMAPRLASVIPDARLQMLDRRRPRGDARGAGGHRPGGARHGRDDDGGPRDAGCCRHATERETLNR